MSGPPLVKSLNCEELEWRPVLGPAGNNSRSLELQKPKGKVEKTQGIDNSNKAKKTQASQVNYSSTHSNGNLKSILRQQQQGPKILRFNFSLNASCSSDASSDSSHSRASTGRIIRRSLTPTIRRKHSASRADKFDKVEKTVSDTDSVSFGSADGPLARKRCAWVTPSTDQCYADFHDEEWGLPVHDDKKLFELLSLCTALAELAWPAILSKRHIFRDVFQDFDPISVSKLNEKKIITPGSPAMSVLSELKLRAIIDNARQVCKIIDELGSFDRYIWGFVNHKPIVSQFRYPRQVPIRTSKADTISKDLVKRGFRGVGPTVIYSFMQVAGITNDHLISCFRFQECIAAGEAQGNDNCIKGKVEEKQSEDSADLELEGALDVLSLST